MYIRLGMIRPNFKQFAWKVRRPKIIKPNIPSKITRPNFKKVRRPTEIYHKDYKTEYIFYVVCINNTLHS